MQANRFFRFLPARFVQFVGWALIAGGILIPLIDFLRGLDRWEHFQQFYSDFKYYFHGPVLGISLPLAVLGILLIWCGASIVYWRKRAEELDKICRTFVENDAETNADSDS